MKPLPRTAPALALLSAVPLLAVASGGWFYQAPLPLSDYHERIPSLTSMQMLREATPRPADAATPEQIEAELKKIVASMAAKPIARDTVLKAMEALLERNRQGDYRVRYANALLDLHDLLSNAAATDDEINAYATWRLTQLEKDDGFFKAAPRKSWDLSDEDYAKALQEWKTATAAERRELGEFITKASPALRPHWQVQLGAMAFRQRDWEEAVRQFGAVQNEAGDSPRKEVASLMLARTYFEQWKENRPTDEKQSAANDNQLHEKAHQAFESFLETYPESRYAPDVPGWLAGMARLSGDWKEFVRQIARQLKDETHPEVMRRALQEFERGLNEMATDWDPTPASYDDLPWNEIAAEPILVMRMVGFFLDPLSTVDDNGRQLSLEMVTTSSYIGGRQAALMRIRKGARIPLGRLAEAVVERYRGSQDKLMQAVQTLALAWASSSAGLQNQAARLMDGLQVDSEEVYFARAVIYSRAQRFKDAITACTTLLSKHPESTLAPETRFRLAAALKDSGDWGGAVLALAERTEAMRAVGFNPNPLPTGEPPLELRLNDELHDWQNTLQSFAPVAQLDGLLAKPATPAELWSHLSMVVRQRWLCEEEFDKALAAVSYTREGVEQHWGHLPSDGGFFDEDAPGELETSAWKPIVTRMAQLKHDAAQAKQPADKAKALLVLAALWDEQRGHLTSQLMDEYPRFEAGQGGCVKLRNAIFLGVPEAQAAETLDRRDELWHAMKLWLQVADLIPGTPEAAASLEKANEALRRMAELNDTGFQRAFERNDTALSKQIYDRLQRDYASSPEAKRAVHWTLPAIGEVTRLPNNYHRDDHEDDITIALTDNPLALGEFPWRYRSNGQDKVSQEERSQNEAARTQLTERWTNFKTQSMQLSAEQLLRTLRSLREATTQTAMPRVEYTAMLNDADDLITFLGTPGIGDRERIQYMALRLDHSAVPEDLRDAASPAASFFAFLRAIRSPFDKPVCEAEKALLEKNTEAPHEDDHALPMALRMEDFLKRFPKSPKREAALTRLAVNTVRASLLRCRIENLAWPESPWHGLYVHPMIQHALPLDEAKAFSVLDQYEKEFPKGRYLAEIHLARALVCLEVGRFKEAAALLVPLLDDKAKPDLHRDASLRLAWLMMRLLEPEKRMAVVDALHSTPNAALYVDRFMQSDTCGARLMLMKDWLEAKLK